MNFEDNEIQCEDQKPKCEDKEIQCKPINEEREIQCEKTKCEEREIQCEKTNVEDKEIQCEKYKLILKDKDIQCKSTSKHENKKFEGIENSKTEKEFNTSEKSLKYKESQPENFFKQQINSTDSYNESFDEYSSESDSNELNKNIKIQSISIENNIPVQQAESPKESPSKHQSLLQQYENSPENKRKVTYIPMKTTVTRKKAKKKMKETERPLSPKKPKQPDEQKSNQESPRRKPKFVSQYDPKIFEASPSSSKLIMPASKPKHRNIKKKNNKTDSYSKGHWIRRTGFNLT